MSDEVAQLIQKQRSNVWIDQGQLAQIEQQYRSGQISEADARRRISQIVRQTSERPLAFTAREIADEWQALSAVLDASENRWKRLAAVQFFIGLAGPPLAVAGILLSLLLGWQTAPGAAVVAALLGACLAAIAAHSFVVLRIHQQAGTAAERLSEKRVGFLFLKLAVTRDDASEATRLLEAGTSMFLGHYAPATLPLEKGDFTAAKV
jgi:hypothetical protein